uniref:PB1-like domain-containing protein n=1 Tax=Tanacetum cinerariifolium TaxID=118510 RepID=A0A6L2MJI6_TANCI|nr:hypothetical protein [Tanacetum cinerariifolium]
MKIHHNVKFSKLPQRRYKFVELDYVDLVDSDMFFLYELCGMLKELGLRDNNKILFTHFKIPMMSFDDGLVPIIADHDVIELLNYVPECKEKEVYIETGVSLVEIHLVELAVSQSQSKGVGNGVVIEEIVKDNVVSSSEKDSKLFMLEWFGMGKEEVVSRSGKESRNSEDVGNLDCDNEVPITNPFSFRDLMEDSDVDVYDVSNKHENVDGVQEQTTFGAQVDPAQDVDEEVVEREEIIVEEEEEKEGFVEDNEDSDFDMDAKKLPYLEPEEFGHDVIDMDELNNGDKGDDENAPHPRKRIFQEIRIEYAGKLSQGELQVFKCDNVRVKAKCFGTVVGGELLLMRHSGGGDDEYSDGARLWSPSQDPTIEVVVNTQSVWIQLLI